MTLFFFNRSLTIIVLLRVFLYFLLEVDKINAVWWNSMDKNKQDSWIKYRQSLLDIPQQEGFPDLINWPIKPE